MNGFTSPTDCVVAIDYRWKNEEKNGELRHDIGVIWQVLIPLSQKTSIITYKERTVQPRDAA